jgi:general secretion pathway protein D
VVKNFAYSHSRSIYLRLGALILCCPLVAPGFGAARAQAVVDSSPAATQVAPVKETQPTEPSQIADPAPSKRRQRAAEDAYLAGAKLLERDDLNGAERQFVRALQLDPGDREYAIAISVARQHRLTALVQDAAKARLAGDGARADTLLAQARAIDPTNPIVAQHNAAGSLEYASAMQAPESASQRAGEAGAGQENTPLTDRARLLAAGTLRQPWQLQAPVLASALHLRPADGTKSFHLRGDAQDVLRQVTAAYGIRAVFDPSVERQNLRFDLEGVPYDHAMSILMSMADVIAVPIDEKSVLIARDDSVNRQRLVRQLEETIFLPGFTVEQLNDLGNVMRNVFAVTKAVVQAGQQDILVVAPEEVLGPMNRTLADLIDGEGELMLDVKLFESDTTHARNVGAIIPTQAGIYNVEAAATTLVNANQALVQQAIAQGLISSTASNIDIALALIGSGLVQSSLLSSTIGFLGHGLTETGVTASTNVGFNLSLNATDTRALDDVQMRVSDRQPATFRTGTKYPVTTSTYTTGLSTAASTASNATINGVSVASLLSQYAGGSSATSPQFTYEDLGVTLKATPTIQRSGRIYLVLDLKIEALAGSSANSIPVLASRQFTSNITVADGESAMMISNVNRNESAAVTGIPGLSELPGFQMPVDQDAEKDAGQLVVVVTPHIVRRRSNLVAGPRILMPYTGGPAGN